MSKTTPPDSEETRILERLERIRILRAKIREEEARDRARTEAEP